jgi:hypothetical protein
MLKEGAALRWNLSHIIMGDRFGDKEKVNIQGKGPKP